MSFWEKWGKLQKLVLCWIFPESANSWYLVYMKMSSTRKNKLFPRHIYIYQRYIYQRYILACSLNLQMGYCPWFCKWKAVTRTSQYKWVTPSAYSPKILYSHSVTNMKNKRLVFPHHTQNNKMIHVIDEIGRIQQKCVFEICKICIVWLTCTCSRNHPVLCSPFIQSVVSNDSINRQWRPWSDCADAQSDLGLCCPHMSKHPFLHGAAQIENFKLLGRGTFYSPKNKLS